MIEDMSARELIIQHHEIMYREIKMLFWSSLLAHFIMHLVLSSFSKWKRNAKTYLNQNLTDHEEIGKMIIRKEKNNAK